MLPSIRRRLPPVRRRWPLAALLVLAMVVAAPGPAGAAITPDPADPGPDGAPAGATDRTPGAVVTLVTGDRVHVARVAGGRQALTVDPARRPGAEPWFQASTYQEQVYVIPSDAAPLVPGTLDRELFNVTKLAEAGYTDGVPVIVTGDPPAGSRTLAAPAGAPTTAGATVTADLPSIDGQALTVASDGRWWRSRSTALAAAATARSGSASEPESERVWLDEPVAATLDESVPLVGAPAAWDAGFDGTGMTVAVLDTGIDASHPDLAGKVVAAENFSEFSDTTTDRFGHGTHVAGIVAGTGAAAGGTYRGVAPRADLMNGKVLGDDGFGLTSDIIEGMQWAVTNGADVVNMSLGGGPSDGTDPLSQAVNQITAEHGVLFVISAGNQLPADHTVTSPGAADAALTVGSVDKAEQLAFDSGRGPRLGDFAIKPDLTAPGVAIASARADGTALGPIVDEHYTVISGTSMAAPHVAAAAAILLQQDPTLDPATLKAALASTAVPNDTLDVYQQGGGRLDLPAALAAPVRANPSPLDLGYFRFPHEETEPVSADVTYTNRTDAPVTLDLSLAVQRHESGPGGPPPGPGPLADPPADGLSVSPATLTVPAGGTATATVTVDVRVGEPGVYGGYLVAQRDGVPVTRTPVGFHKEAESYQLTIRGTARDGRPATGSSIVNVMDVSDTRRFLQTGIRYVDGEATLRVPAGVYSILGVTFSYGDDPRYEQERVFVGDPEVEVTSDTTVELDARDAHPVTVQTPDDPGAAPIQRVQFAHYRAAEEFGAHDLTYIGPVIPEYAMATEPVTLGAFEYYTRWRIAEPQLVLSVTEPTERALSPWEMDRSPAMDGDLRLPLVDAGLGAAEDYQGIDAEGAIVLTQRGGPDDATKEATARAAGAAALVVANHQAGNYRSFVGDDAQIPAMTVSRADGDALRALLAAGPVTLRLAGNPASPYLYDVVLAEPGQVPVQPHYRVRRSDLATVEATFHSDAAAGHRQGEVRHFFRPWADSSFGIVLGLPVPLTRTELLVGGDTRYRQQITAGGGASAGLLEEPLTSYQPGERRQQSWFAPVNRPGFLDEHDPGSDLPSVRDGDSLAFAIPEWADGYGHWGPRARGVDTTAARLYADGELVGEATRSAGRFPVGPDPATYRFEVDVNRAAPWWSTSTATRTAWTFQSARPAGAPELLPLLTVDADPGADLRNTAPGGARTIGLRVGHQPGATGPAIDSAQVRVSYDDGGSWQEATVRETGAGQFEADLPAPAEPDGFASLQVSAADAAGNRIEQEVARAWRFAGPACDRTVTGVHIGPLLVSDGVTCLAEGGPGGRSGADPVRRRTCRDRRHRRRCGRRRRRRPGGAARQ